MASYGFPSAVARPTRPGNTQVHLRPDALHRLHWTGCVLSLQRRRHRRRGGDRRGGGLGRGSARCSQPRALIFAGWPLRTADLGAAASIPRCRHQLRGQVRLGRRGRQLSNPALTPWRPGSARRRMPLGKELAWNFGVALLPLDRWRAQGLTQRVTRWFDANSKHRLFPPDSADDDRCDEGGEEHRRGTCLQPSPHQRPSATQVASGLGLPYLIFKGSVGCWADDTVLDGLGYVDTTDLHKSGVSAKDMSGCPRPCIPRSPGAP